MMVAAIHTKHLRAHMSARAWPKIACFCLAFAGGAAQAQDHAQQRIASLLFPESASWRDVAALPQPAARLFNALQVETLWDRVRHADVALQNVPGCMGVLRMFYDPQNRPSFHMLAVPRWGEPGLLYSGAANCREGGVTIIWKDASSLAQGTPAIDLNELVLRIEDAADPRVTTIAVGCCADPIDVYQLRLLLRQRVMASVRVEKALVLPDKLEAAHQMETVPRELVLRRAPVVDDTYDATMSGFYGVAAFGNIERRYLAGAKVTILGTWHDKKGAEWKLAEVPNALNAGRATYSSTDAELGWMQGQPKDRP